MTKNKKLGKCKCIAVFIALIMLVSSVSLMYSSTAASAAVIDDAQKKACYSEYNRAWDSVSLSEKGKELEKAKLVAEGKFNYRMGARFGGVCKSMWDSKKEQSSQPSTEYGRFVSAGISAGGNKEWGFYQEGTGEGAGKWYYTTKSTEELVEGGKIVDESQLLGKTRTQVSWNSEGVFYPQNGFESAYASGKKVEGTEYVYLQNCQPTKGVPSKDCYIDNTGMIYTLKDNNYLPRKDLYLESTKGNVPDQMQYNIDPFDDYVLDPKSSLSQSVQAVCLPATQAYLKSYRTVADAIRKCVKTVRVTGEGNTGVCEALVSRYVCDFIMDQILCRASGTKAGKMRQASTRQGNFLSVLTGDMGTTDTSISRRYGSDNMFKSIFSERKLANSMCLKAFSGDWGVDLESLLSSDYTIPINSEGFVNPATRKFISVNPLNGKVTYIYHIGSALIAGSDLTFQTKLVCSNDDSCIGSDYPDNHCDCFGMSAPMEKPLIGDRLLAGEMFGEDERADLYVTLDDNEPLSIRYDKVVLQWIDEKECRDWGNPKCTIIKPITEIGQRPPMDCRFEKDMIDPPQYICSFEASRYGDAWFSQDLMAKGTDQARDVTYYLYDTITLGADESDTVYAFKKMPKGKEYPVYYHWQIKNDKGMVIKNSEIMTIEEEKTEINQFTKFEITREKVIEGQTGELNINRGYSCTMQGNPGIEFDGNIKCNKNFKLYYENRQFKVQVAGGNAESCSGSDATKKVVCTKSDVSFSYKNNLGDRKIGPVDVTYGLTSSQDTTINVEELCPTKTTGKWYLEAGLYPAEFDSNGNPSDKKSDTPYSHSGTEQKVKINFKVSCTPNPGTNKEDKIFFMKNNQIQSKTKDGSDLPKGAPMYCKEYFDKIVVSDSRATTLKVNVSVYDINDDLIQSFEDEFSVETSEDGDKYVDIPALDTLTEGDPSIKISALLGDKTICSLNDQSSVRPAEQNLLEVKVSALDNMNRPIAVDVFRMKAGTTDRKNQPCGDVKTDGTSTGECSTECQVLKDGDWHYYDDDKTCEKLGANFKCCVVDENAIITNLPAEKSLEQVEEETEEDDSSSPLPKVTRGGKTFYSHSGFPSDGLLVGNDDFVSEKNYCNSQFKGYFACYAATSKKVLTDKKYECKASGACSGKDCCGSGKIYCCKAPEASA